jgi:hypothetical protein
MPSLNDILLQTMPLTASPGSVNTFFGPKSTQDIVADPPTPRRTTIVKRDSSGQVTTPSQDLRRRINVWSWKHSGSDPASVKEIRSFVLGMGMDYSHPMSVFDEIRVDDVSITFSDGTDFPHLPLTTDFVLRKYQFLGDPSQLGRNIGFIPNSSSGLWRIEAFLDQSLMVVFGYDFKRSGPPDPIDPSETTKSNFMPLLVPKGGFPCDVGQVVECKLETPRIVVCFSLTCCMENNDFEPGKILGANRILPHVMLMSNVELKSAKATIKVMRPGKSSHVGDEMQPDIGPILFTDTNTPPSQVIGAALPFWYNMFDYYETDPLNKPETTKPLQMVVGDPSAPRFKPRPAGSGKGLILKLDSPRNALPSYERTDLLKTARQGDFDNLHLAPKMSLPTIPNLSDGAIRTTQHLDNIAMAPFCVHDCLHTHVRWGTASTIFLELLSEKLDLAHPLPASAKGFDNNFQPYTVEGAAQVPHNQSVIFTLLPPAGLKYQGIAHFDVNPGQWQVFFHHGSAYANELWDVDPVKKACFAVDAISLSRGERIFFPLTAVTSFALLYWRLRWGGNVDPRNLLGAPMERVVFNLAQCMAL